MSTHAKRAPSSAKRWIHCPGSVRLSEGYPDTSSPQAREGTAAHELAEMSLAHNLDAIRYRGVQLQVESETFTVDEAMAGYVQEYIDVVRRLQVYGSLSHYEAKVSISKDIYGTADAVVRDTPIHLNVADLKYGAGVHVPVADNEQLKIYAIGALSMPGMEFVTAVETHIVQPRHRLGGHSSQSYTVAELRAWERDVLLPAAARTYEPDAPLCVGEWCQFCPAKAECPALEAQALGAAREVFTPQLEAIVPPALDQVTPERLAQILGAIPMAEKWFKAVKEHAAKVAASGGSIPGYKRVQSVGNREWVDAEAAAAELRLYGDVFTDPKPAVLKSPAQVEKAIGKAQFDLVSQFTHKPNKGVVLVPDSDKRPAHDAAAVFTKQS